MFQNDKFTVVDSSKIISDTEQHLNFKSKEKKKAGLSSTKCCGPISITGDEPSVASGTWPCIGAIMCWALSLSHSHYSGKNQLCWFGKWKDGQHNTRNLPVKALTGEQREKREDKEEMQACRVAWEGVWGEEGTGSRARARLGMALRGIQGLRDILGTSWDWEQLWHEGTGLRDRKVGAGW